MNKKNVVHIGIIWANPYSNNLGVAALAYSSLALLNDVCRENNIDARFTLVGNRGKEKDKISINNCEIFFNNVLGNDHSKWKSLARLVLYPRRCQTMKLLNLDIIFDISEGDSFTDIYGDKRHKKFLNSKRFFNLLRTPQVLLPQTIGPFNSKRNEEMAFKAMKKMKLVISRDKQSLDYTAQFLPENKIKEAIDVAFYMPFERRKFDKENIHVGINISGLLWNGGYTKKNQFALEADYRSLIENAINYFAHKDNVTIHFVSHVLSRRKSVEDDYAVAEEFHLKYPGSVLAPAFKSPIEAKSYISSLDFFFGSRMHACIAAISSGVPVFPMAYSRKFNGLFSETLQYKWLGDCTKETEDVILEKLQTAYHQRLAIKEEIGHLNSNVVSYRLDSLKNQLLKSISNVKFSH
ncbi:polysaccharide pyruvyl transferase family protein [Chitinophagaceae bacterium LB-8]|uniref:Polysaccharide pyruvyl transferase family protein n=1 Tax=Paraflavisolibacter caeni TaxID=2982496 RepID=A0A9X2XSH6_9BACT|nr:polysaccharide pyruvyl transferase family protein [Paraflavisolibacter caeni]MCU7548269.1 polysaccharide pyruvyl transferase family protein [Paraflavisolibacter caeni]